MEIVRFQTTGNVDYKLSIYNTTPIVITMEIVCFQTTRNVDYMLSIYNTAILIAS